MASNTLLSVNLGLLKNASVAAVSSEAKTNDQMQHGGLHGNQGRDQSQNVEQGHICTGYRLDRGRCHTVYSILRAGNQ